MRHRSDSLRNGLLSVLFALPVAGVDIAHGASSEWSQVQSTAAAQELIFRLIHGADLPAYKRKFIAAMPPQERKRYVQMSDEEFNLVDGVTLAEFRIIDLDQDGSVELVAVVALGGRQLLNTIVVVYDSTGAPQFLHALSDPPNRLADQLVDLDGNGTIEVIVHEALRGDMAARRALWSSVLEWQDGSLIRSDHKFQKFYADIVLPSITSQIATMSSRRYALEIHPGIEPSVLAGSFEVPEGQPLGRAQRELTDEEKEVLLSIYHVLAHRARRLAKVDDAEAPRRAARWAKSGRHELRASAIVTLEDLGGPEAERSLEKLSNDSDPRVSGRAAAALGRIRKDRKK